MYGQLKDELAETLAGLREQGTYKRELVMTTPQGAHVEVEGRGELLNLCANNYLGLANHPAVVEAAHAALDRWGYGMASVRFICGTQALHRELEEHLSRSSAPTTRSSSPPASTRTAASSRRCSPTRTPSSRTRSTTPRSSTGSGSARRSGSGTRTATWTSSRRASKEATGARRRLIATDGVFSMDGYLAKLDRICDLADRHDALVMVDDSHAVGVVGPGGRGTPEHCGVDRAHRHRHRHARQGGRRRERRLRRRPRARSSSCSASAHGRTSSRTASPRPSSRRASPRST